MREAAYGGRQLLPSSWLCRLQEKTASSPARTAVRVRNATALIRGLTYCRLCFRIRFFTAMPSTHT
jgi:hypothetical protein